MPPSTLMPPSMMTKCSPLLCLTSCTRTSRNPEPRDEEAPGLKHQHGQVRTCRKRAAYQTEHLITKAGEVRQAARPGIGMAESAA